MKGFIERLKWIVKMFWLIVFAYILIIMLAYWAGIFFQPIRWSYIAGEKTMDRIEKFYYVNILGWNDAEINQQEKENK